MTVATTASKPKKQSSAPPPPPRVDRALVTKAVEALLKYHAKRTQSAASSDLLGNDSPIQVQLTLEIAPERAQHKPISVLLPHPIHKLNSSSSNQEDDDSSLEMEEICLIVKEEAKPAIQDVIQKHFPNELKCIKKVMGLQSLRTKHATSFAQRRSLLHKYTTFLADDRILPMLTSALGRDFYKYNKKQPIPIKVTNPNNLPLMLQKALGGGTHLYLPAGTCVTVRAGHTTMSAPNLVDNILAVCASYRCSNNNNNHHHQQQLLLNHSLGAIRKIPRQWANVRQIAIKTANSTALPVYNATPAQLEELTRLAGLEPVWKNKNNKSKSANSKDKNYAETTTTTTTATMTKDKAAVTTTKTKKSPLLRALEKQKKQQQQQQDDDVVVSIPDKKQPAETTTTKKPKRKNNSNAETKTSTAKESKTRDKKSNKKDTSLSPSAEKSSARGKRKNSDAADNDNNTSSPSSKKIKNNSSSSSSSKQEPSEPTFIASKRFKGSKKGYMFQKGPKGIGYYVDVKPIVDRMALEAIFRMTAAQNQQHRGNHKSKSPRGRGGKGKRNSHRRR